jgi:Zn-finger nucleic acid-binding protein
MRSCPTCGETVHLEIRALEESKLRADHCPRCDGVWLTLSAYAQWLERGSPSGASDPGSLPPQKELNDGPFMRRCPDCRYILGRYRVGHDVPFTIDRCHNCRGVWLDSHEWAGLKQRGLHVQLHQIFTDDWQREIRQKATAAQEDARLRKQLGSADYDRILEFRRWISQHPRRDTIWGLLHDRDRPTPPG